MAHGTASEVADKLINRLGLSRADIEAGINAVTENPAAKASANSAKWVRNVASSEGKFKAGLSKVTLEQWKSAFIAKIDRIPSGVAASRDKIVTYFQEALPVIDAAAARVRAMPDATIQDAIARSSAMIQAMYEWGQRRGGGRKV